MTGTTSDRSDPGLHEIGSDGMQEKYLVLPDDEGLTDFIRPYRDRYKHLVCGGVTTMGRAIAETYAKSPLFYGGTYCAICHDHFPVGKDGQFVWEQDGSKVGT